MPKQMYEKSSNIKSYIGKEVYSIYFRVANGNIMPNEIAVVATKGGKILGYPGMD